MKYLRLGEELKILLTTKSKWKKKRILARIKAYYPKEGILAGTQKRLLIELDDLLNGKVGDHQRTVDVLLGIERSINLSPDNKSDIQKIKKIIKTAPAKKCEHKNLMILAFVHGGGFTPEIFLPELICKDCFLNVTLLFDQIKDCITIPKSIKKEITDWMSSINLGKVDFKGKYIGVEEVIKNPVESHKKALRFQGDLTGLKIIDSIKLEQVSG